jgi:hypothetical protein
LLHSLINAGAPCTFNLSSFAYNLNLLSLSPAGVGSLSTCSDASCTITLPSYNVAPAPLYFIPTDDLFYGVVQLSWQLSCSDDIFCADAVANASIIVDHVNHPPVSSDVSVKVLENSNDNGRIEENHLLTINSNYIERNRY